MHALLLVTLLASSATVDEGSLRLWLQGCDIYSNLVSLGNNALELQCIIWLAAVKGTNCSMAIATQQLQTCGRAVQKPNTHASFALVMPTKDSETSVLDDTNLYGVSSQLGRCTVKL